MKLPKETEKIYKVKDKNNYIIEISHFQKVIRAIKKKFKRLFENISLDKDVLPVGRCKWNLR